MEKHPFLGIAIASVFFLFLFLFLSMPFSSVVRPDPVKTTLAAGQSDVLKEVGDFTGARLLGITILLMLPFTFFLFRGSKNDELDSELWPYNNYLVGTKGGKSTAYGEQEEVSSV